MSVHEPKNLKIRIVSINGKAEIQYRKLPNRKETPWETRMRQAYINRIPNMKTPRTECL
jgi:hypothetical protein